MYLLEKSHLQALDAIHKQVYMEILKLVQLQKQALQLPITDFKIPYTEHILIHLLIIYGFTSHTRIFHLYEDVTIAGEGLQKLGLCSAPLSREESLSCHTYCDMGPRFFWSHPKDRPI
jgi:hypothetical protein